MGILTAMAILVALVVDFVLLPALLLLPTSKQKGTDDVTSPEYQNA
jgi:hypothetical protein